MGVYQSNDINVEKNRNDIDYSYLFKITLVGSSDANKTKILKSLYSNELTIGLDFVIYYF